MTTGARGRRQDGGHRFSLRDQVSGSGEEGRPTSGLTDLSRATLAGGCGQGAGRSRASPRAAGVSRATPATASKIMTADPDLRRQSNTLVFPAAAGLVGPACPDAALWAGRRRNRCQAWLWVARSRRTWLIWLMITWAEASMAWATGLDGSRSWAAIWAADRPARTCGLY